MGRQIPETDVSSFLGKKLFHLKTCYIFIYMWYHTCKPIQVPLNVCRGACVLFVVCVYTCHASG